MEAVDGGHRADSRTGEGEKLMPCSDTNANSTISGAPGLAAAISSVEAFDRQCLPHALLATLS
jgi:hypothetical protein